MKRRGHLWILAFLALIGFDGPGSGPVDPGHEASGPREASAPATAASPAALSACVSIPAEDTRRDPHLRTPPTAVASSATPSPIRPRSRASAGSVVRRPFAETVSYRTTAPPSRIA